jgi:hypothetical protein
MGLEGQMWKFLRPELHRAGLRAERLTDRLIMSRPDVLWCDSEDGLTGLCELKAPGPKDTDLGLRPGQAAFLWSWVRQSHGLGSILVRWPSDAWGLFVPGREPSWIPDIEQVLVAPTQRWDDFPGGTAIRMALRAGRSVQRPQGVLRTPGG